jgi:hypothetical protein
MTSIAELDANKSPMPTVGTTLSQYVHYADATAGFKEFTPRDPATQDKYDAMSKTWQGAESSSAAVLRGDFSLDAAEKTRQDLKSKPQQTTPEAQWTCSLQ